MSKNMTVIKVLMVAIVFSIYWAIECMDNETFVKINCIDGYKESDFYKIKGTA